ncbi:MAG: uroporphyrinogen-III synthase [Acidobacteriota bacterium]
MKPLAGRRVVITRALHQAPELAQALRRAGAEPHLLPLIEVVPPRQPELLAETAQQAAQGTFDWWVFTSRNAVDALLDRLPATPARRPAIAVVGAATARHVEERGYPVAFQATRADAVSLGEELAPEVAGASVVLPQAADARPAIAAALEAHAGRLTKVEAYRKIIPPDSADRARQLFGDGPLGWVTFTSPRIAQNFRGLFGSRWPSRRPSLLAASIGPVTSRALRRLGVAPTVEADRATVDGLVAALAAFRPQG